jgi:aconitate hydratase
MCDESVADGEVIIGTLGIRAVLAVSFDRIHRSNPIGTGILRLRFASGTLPDTLQLQPSDKLDVDTPADTLSPRCKVPVRVVRANGTIEPIDATAAVETRLEHALFRSGGVIPPILRKSLAAQQA